jgi:hypothetical protein
LSTTAAIAAAGAALFLGVPLATAAAQPATTSIGVAGMKILDNDTRRVSFTAASTPRAGAYSWGFGDPSSGVRNRSAAARPVHVFAAHRTYVVTLAVTTRHGLHATAVFRLKL